MRKFLFIALSVILSVSACTHKQPESPKSPQESYHSKAENMYYNSEPISECIAMQQLAVDRMRAGNSPENGYKVLSQMGHFYSRAGIYDEALRYLQEASDSLHAGNPDSIIPFDAIKLLGNLSNLYGRLGLFEEALQKNHDAIVISESSYPNIQPDLWRMRGTIYELDNKLDDALECMRKSVALIPLVSDENLRNRYEIINNNAVHWFFIEHYDFIPDSVASAVEALERNIGKYAPNDNANKLLAGRGRVLLGDSDRGLRMMEDALEGYRGKGDEESVEWALQLLAKSYAATGSRRLIDIYQEAASLHDTIMTRKRDDALLGKDFRYRTAELKSENRLLEKELSVSRERLVFIIAICVLVIIMTLLFIIVMRRHQKQLLRQKQQSIDSLIADHIALNDRIESLNDKLSARTAGEENNALLNTVLMEKDEELRFRKIFSDIYPGFIDRMRRDYPWLTPGNELLCMLICLRKNNNEIALALGISRESVTTARYRLRSRFKLAKDVDLNDFILSRL